MTSEAPGRLYSLVTKHWPRVATGLVLVIGLVELVVGGLTADSGSKFRPAARPAKESPLSA